MAGVKIREGESFESLIKRFRKVVTKEKIIEDAKKAMVYEKPSEERKKELIAARRRWLRRIKKEE
ncbi:MAG: 30S ribosomal protein S21 [candidate division WOR-3 bacterium]|nr:30S ribosomal protein S21 [candidate division WOR-3 bacterium]MCX7947188.1 30S ribosomal protein S21 [candidate division WOR-3 bacterium]MDW8150244.1 30S ribosomal protein S21 [candidate division WOR-3 bacterium]